MARRDTARTATEEPAIDIVSRIQRAEPELSPAERRVAAAVQLDFEAATRLTIADLAARAGVSQPTVTRFCRSVGCASFSDFKISLASTMTVAAVYLRSDRVFNDDIGQLAQTVMMRAAATVRETLDQLDTIAVSAAIAAFSAARRIDIYGQGGGSAALMEDAKLQRIGPPILVGRALARGMMTGGACTGLMKRALRFAGHMFLLLLLSKLPCKAWLHHRTAL